MEAARLLEHFDTETKLYDVHGLPLSDDTLDPIPRSRELRSLLALRLSSLLKHRADQPQL